MSNSHEKPNLTREQLKLSHQRVSSLINSLPLVFAIVDDNGIIVGGNPALKSIFAYEQRELAGHEIGMLFRSPPWVDGGLKEWQMANPERTVQVDGVRKDGKIVPVDISIRNYEVANQDLLLVIIQDVSERVKLEKLKRDFFAMVSHDMRSPLGSIVLSIDMILEADLPPEIADPLKRVGNNSKHLVRLINDLLDIDKVEEGHIKLIYSIFSMNDVIAEALDIVQAQGIKRRITLHLDSAELEQKICADQDRILRVLINLLSNAIKFSPKGGRIDLNILSTPEYLEVSIQDEGRGIPEDKLDLIFERFGQVQASDATKKGGTGLGLAICKGFVEAHGGMIKAENRSDKSGSRFCFRIPHRELPLELENETED